MHSRPAPSTSRPPGRQAPDKELGVTRVAAEAIMRQLPVVQFEGLRKVYVRRGDVRRLLEERTFTKDQVAA
jgi:hypothetical protein